MALPPVNGHAMIYKKYSPNLFKWYLLGMSFRGELFCAKRLVQCRDNSNELLLTIVIVFFKSDKLKNYIFP